MSKRGLIFLAIFLVITIVFQACSPILQGLNLFLQGVLLLASLTYFFKLQPSKKVFLIVKAYFLLLVVLIINYNFSDRGYVIYLFTTPYAGCFFSLLIWVLLFMGYQEHRPLKS